VRLGSNGTGFTAASDRFSINVSLFIDPPTPDEMQNRSELIDFGVLPTGVVRYID